MAELQKKTNKITSENEVRRIVNTERSRIWDRKYTKTNIYIERRRSMKIHKKTTTEKRERMPIPAISYKQ
jgi:hypothetical protein